MRRRGVALLVVVMVLAALAAIALPFSVAMSQHLRAMRVHSAETRARLAAEGALAHAVAVLYRTQDSTEEESLTGGSRSRGPAYGAPWNTPEYDSVDELEVSPRHTLGKATLAALKDRGISFADSRGTIWSARVEDEQGKINVASAPPELLGGLVGATVLTEPLDGHSTTLYVVDASSFFSDDDPTTVDGKLRIDGEEMRYLSADGNEISVRRDAENASRHRAGSVVCPAEAHGVASRAMNAEEGVESRLHTLRSLKEFLTPEQFDAMERYVTVWSYRDSASGWIRKEEVKNDFLGSDAGGVLVEDASNYGCGAYARLSLNGEVQNVLRVMQPIIRGGEYDIIVFQSGVGFVKTKTDEASVELLQRHPVNVNTAPRSVLVSVFQGLSMRGDYVDGEEAEALADYILSLDEPIKGESDLKEIIEAARDEGVISRTDAKAVIENALVQSSHDLFYSTMTFCYKTHGSFTVEATGVVNTPAGVPLATHTLREVMSLPPTASGQYTLVSQKDFDVAMRGGPGSKLVATWPNALSDPEHYEPDETVTDPDEFGDVRIQSARMAEPSGWKVEHFEQMTQGFEINPDGLDLTRGGSITLNANAGFASGDLNVKPGAFSMWFKPEIVGGRQCLFDIGEDESQNRVTLHHDANADEFILRVCGPEKVPSGTVAPEFHLPWDIDAGIWYHVAACWKGTLPWQACVRVDGRPRGGSDPYYLPGSRLAGDINAAVDFVGVTDASYFPQKGVVRIGDEIIEYESRTDTSLDECERGRRFSYASDHKRGDTVCPYGYSNYLSDALHKGGATLAEDLPPWTRPRPRLSDDVDWEAGNTFDLPVRNGTTGYQSRGFFKISGVIVYYEKLTSNNFEDCSIHLSNDSQGTFSDNTTVGEQASIRISGYTAGSYMTGSGAYASVQPNRGPVEWVRVGAIETEFDGEKSYFFIVPRFYLYNDAYRYDDPWRGDLGTSKLFHSSGEKVMPVARMRWPRCGNYEPRITEDRTQDEITVIDSTSSSPEEARIRRGHYEIWWHWYSDQRTSGKWMYRYRVCLDRFLSKKYETGDKARFLKFPSGELPTSLPGQVTAGSADDGGDCIYSVIDEVGFGTGTEATGMIAYDNDLARTDTTITVAPDIFCNAENSAPDLPSNGPVLLGGELVHYESKQTTDVSNFIWYPAINKQQQWITDHPDALFAPTIDGLQNGSLKCVSLEDCTRGAVGTQASEHRAGVALVALDDYPLTVLEEGGGQGDDEAKVKNAANFPDEGYVFFPQTGEVMGWEERDGTTLLGCEDLRGCFGTAPLTHASGELALAIPFRYWSRYVPCTNSSAWCYYQFSCTRPGAVWRSIEWEEADYTGQGSPEGARPVFFVQFDGYPGWDEEPANRPGAIWMFSRGGEHSFGGVAADEMRVRVGFSPVANAFRKDGSSQQWKTTPMVKNVTVRYLMVPLVRERDELDSP